MQAGSPMAASRSRLKYRMGFTLIELLVVLAVLAILAGITAPLYLERVDEARETTLRHNLLGLRQAIDQFYRDKGRYPKSLEELVQARYVRAVPEDPMTGRADTWILVPAQESDKESIFDVRSGADGRAKDGSTYVQW